MALAFSQARFNAKGLFLAGKLLNTAGTPSVSFVSDQAFAGNVSVTDNGAGDWTLTVKGFKGLYGHAVPVLTTGTISVFASAVSVSYSGDDLSVQIKMEDDTSAATDCDVYFQIFAF